MRRNITCFIIIIASLSLAGFAQPDVSAESGTITISAMVLPAKYVYVDENMHIIKIVSNTPNDAPVVPLSTSLPTQKISLTPQISKEYAQISKQVNLLQYGHIYPQPKLAIKQKSRIFKALAQVFRPFTMRLWI